MNGLSIMAEDKVVPYLFKNHKIEAMVGLRSFDRVARSVDHWIEPKSITATATCLCFLDTSLWIDELVDIIDRFDHV